MPKQCHYRIGPTGGGGMRFDILGPVPPDKVTREAVLHVLLNMADLTRAEAEAMLAESAHHAMVSTRGVALSRTDP